MKPDISRAIVAGHICLDIIPDMQALTGDQFAAACKPGRLIEIGRAHFSTGGPVSNTGLALHRLGIPTRLICKAGADPFGDIIRGILDEFGRGLGKDMVAAADVSTSYSIILSPADSDRIVLHEPGANNSFSLNDIDLSGLSAADLFHFGYPPIMRSMYADGGAGLIALFAAVKKSGVTTSLDMCLPDPLSAGGQADWKTILQSTLPNVDIFLPSYEELLYMLRRSDYRRLADRGPVPDEPTLELVHDLSDELFAMGISVLVIKMGDQGLYLRTNPATSPARIGRAAVPDEPAWADKELWIPCFKVNVVGTNGSGDATIAGFLTALLRGLSAEEAVRAAVAVGACNVEAADTLSGLRSWEETMQRIASGWEQRPLALAGRGWRWDAAARLWRKA